MEIKCRMEIFYVYDILRNQGIDCGGGSHLG